VSDDERDSGQGSASSGPSKEEKAGGDSTPGGPWMRDLFEDAARALGRTAGRTRDAIARLGERGALAVAARQLEHTRAQKLRKLGDVARKALSLPGGILRRDDARASDLMQAIDRMDEKLARMRERIHKNERATDGEPGQESDACEDEDGKTDGPREE